MIVKKEIRNIEAVIFDMDGVIIDSEPVHMKVERDIFHEMGITITNNEHQKLVGKSLKNMAGEVIEKYQLSITREELIKRIRDCYLEEIKRNDCLSLVEGVREAIRCLHIDKELIIASSATRKEIEWIINKYNLKQYFSVVISGAEMERSKPDPAIFLKAAKLSNISPGHCCVIEDSGNGVLAAKSAGMYCIGFRNPNSGNQDLSKADVIVSDMKVICSDVINRIGIESN